MDASSATTIIGSATSAVTSLATSIFEVVTKAVGNASKVELIGLGIAFVVLGYGISLLPRFIG